MHPGSFIVTDSRIKGHGTEIGVRGTDLILRIGRLTDKVCMTINDTLGIDNPSNAPPVDSWSCHDAIKGTFQDCPDPIGDTVTALEGKEAFCARSVDTSLHNIFIQLLIAR